MIEYSKYNGNDLIVLRAHRREKFPLKFGVAKAVEICGAVEEVFLTAKATEKKKLTLQVGGQPWDLTTKQCKTLVAHLPAVVHFAKKHLRGGK